MFIPAFVEEIWLRFYYLTVLCDPSQYANTDSLQTEHKASIRAEFEVLILHHIVNADQITNICVDKLCHNTKQVYT